MSTNYKIIIAPKYIKFDCPNCHEEDAEVDFDDVDFNTDCWVMVHGYIAPNVEQTLNLAIMNMIEVKQYV